MTTLINLLRSVPFEALLFVLLCFLVGVIALIRVLRRRFRKKPAQSGWEQFEERVEELRQKEE